MSETPHLPEEHDVPKREMLVLPDQIERGQELGRGGNSTVYEVKDHPHLVVRELSNAWGGGKTGRIRTPDAGKAMQAEVWCNAAAGFILVQTKPAHEMQTNAKLAIDHACSTCFGKGFANHLLA